ncbi:hypothetical protein JC2156_10140 [Weissella koreensis KCTC 3621]|nr:hypothetical protein JC2156_10140 [Weissella koreensis KCTC 3621]
MFLKDMRNFFILSKDYLHLTHLKKVLLLNYSINQLND